MKTITNKLFENIRLRRLLVLILFLSFSFFTNAQTFNSGGEYIDYIGQQYVQLKEDLWDYQKAAAHSKRIKKIDKRRTELINTTKSIKEKVKNMPGYEGNTDYRDAVFNYLDMQYHTLIEDYAKIVDLEAIAEQSYDNMEAYLTAKEEVSNKLNEAQKTLRDEQEKFAEANKINLVASDDKLSKKIEKASEVNGYYNDLFLIFFKSHKQEAYLIEAQNKADVNAIEQNKNTLQKYANEAIKKLNTIKSFDNDATLKSACRQLQTFYLSEVKKTTSITNFFLAKEKFEKVKASFEAKKQSKRTKADVDQYNNTLAKYNNAVNAFNKTNQELNKSRTKFLNNWEKTVAKFIHTHTP